MTTSVKVACHSAISRFSLSFVIAATGLALMLGIAHGARVPMLPNANHRPDVDVTCFATPDGGTTVFSTTDASAVQQAVDTAGPGSTVKVAGYCAGVQEIVHASQTVLIRQPLTLQGGYTATNWGTSFPLTQPTVLDAQSLGKVIFAYDDLILRDLTVQNGNCAISICPGGSGGGITALNRLSLNNVSVLSNTATNEGGGVYAFGMVQLSSSLFQSNHCTNAGCHGGGLSVYSTLMLTGTRFLNNTAAGLGGGAYVASGLLSGSNRLVNGLFAGNTASEAAALYLIDPASGSGVAVVINTTITSPTLSSGSAIGIGTGTVDITNTIIASYTFGISNTDGTVAEDYNLFFGTIATGTQSIKYGGHSIRADPDFVNPDANNYHLASASAAIDRGVDTGIYDDLDGNPRPQGAGYDIGAYEFGSFVDLSIVKSVTPAAAASGQAITYTLAFSNAGNRTAADVVITDTGSTSWVSNMTYTASIPVTPTEDASISWQAGNFAPAATGIITLTGIFSPATGGEAKYINVARIGSSDTEIITTNNSSSSEVILRQITVYLPIIMH